MCAGLRAPERRAPLLAPRRPARQLRCAEDGRGPSAHGPRQADGQLLHPARVSGDLRTGENGIGRHGGQVRQQRVQQQEEETPDDLHQRAAGGAGEGLSEDALSRCLREGTAGHEDGINGGQSAGVVSEQKSKMEETRTLRANPTSQDPLRSHLRPVGAAEDRRLHADPQQPVARRGPRRPRGVLLHAAPGLAALRRLLLPLATLGRRRRARLRGLPQPPAEPVRPRLPQQLLRRRRLPPRAGRQRAPRVRDQARVREALVQHRRAAHEGQGAHGQHLVGHVSWKKSGSWMGEKKKYIYIFFFFHTFCLVCTKRGKLPKD